MKLSNILFISFLYQTVAAGNWDTYPQVPKTASINGFADPIESKLPSCAKDCVKFDTDNTPCPYWDTGCLCVMPQWSGEVAECFASLCSGSDFKSATSLAYSLCSSCGADVWLMPESVSTVMSKAAGVKHAQASTTGDSSSVASSRATDSTSNLKNSTTTTSSAYGDTSTTSNADSTGSSSSNGAHRVLGLNFIISLLPLLSMF